LRHKTYFNWSSGKDSALALYRLLQEEAYSVDYLLTAVNAVHDRVSMHGLRRELLQQQLDAIGIPSGTIELPETPSNEDYEQLMRKQLLPLKAAGFTHAGFGDIFLEDLRRYREEQLARLELQAVFPLWKQDTRQLLQDFIDTGFKTIVVCVNAALLDRSFAGRVIDESFLRDLPPGVDPCGENGEFHTFCFDGPLLKRPVVFEIGETVYREYTTERSSHGFWFCDLLPV
jgi:uncharacterized protein (TIGR00290 family)